MDLNWIYEIWIIREIIRPLLDITLLAFIFYRSYQILVQSRAVQLIKGAWVILIIFVMAKLMRLNTLSSIMDPALPYLIIAVAIIFQPELRKIFTRIGQRNWFRFNTGVKKYHLESVINSIEVLSLRKIGSIIILARHVGLKTIIETGTLLNAELSSSLILSIFSQTSPIHDGAIVLRDDKIVAAGCFLPLSEQLDIKKSFGTRHRAALGLAEETDAVVIVVSEENGAISLAYDAQLFYDLSIDFISKKLNTLFEIRQEEEKAVEE